MSTSKQPLHALGEDESFRRATALPTGSSLKVLVIAALLRQPIREFPKARVTAENGTLFADNKFMLLSGYMYFCVSALLTVPKVAAEVFSLYSPILYH